jgi:hypothetical protein
MKLNHDKDSFYPDLPSPRIPTTLPLLSYTGTYYHPSYRNITIFLKDGVLAANRTNSTVSSRCPIQSEEAETMQLSNSHWLADAATDLSRAVEDSP